jgi:hypothetical protein
MRYVLLLVILILSITVSAQRPLSRSLPGASQNGNLNDSSHLLESASNKKWFFSFYSGLSASYGIFNGGNATVFAVPVGLRFNRQLTNNLYGFTGISVAPAFVNFNSSFLSADVNKMYPGNSFKSNYPGLYSRAEMGLMYVNDSRTFSVSGSIGVQRGSNQTLRYQPMNTLGAGPFYPAK